MSLAPDAGMGQLAAGLARRNADAAQAAAGDSGGAGVELDVFGRLAVALDRNSAEHRAARAAAQIPWEYCHPILLAPVAINGAGTINDERWEPRESWVWHILRVSVQSNAAGGATSALLAQDSANVAGAFNLQSFPPAGSAALVAGSFMGCWEPKGKFLMAGQRLILTAVAGGAIINGEAIEIARDWLPTYLM
jgi:hypothetical protein